MTTRYKPVLPLMLWLWAALMALMWLLIQPADGQNPTPIANLSRTNVVVGSNLIAVVSHPGVTNGTRGVRADSLFSNWLSGSITVGTNSGILWATNGSTLFITNPPTGQVLAFHGGMPVWTNSSALGGGSGTGTNSPTSATLFNSSLSVTNATNFTRVFSHWSSAVGSNVDASASGGYIRVTNSGLYDLSLNIIYRHATNQDGFRTNFFFATTNAGSVGTNLTLVGGPSSTLATNWLYNQFAAGGHVYLESNTYVGLGFFCSTAPPTNDLAFEFASLTVTLVAGTTTTAGGGFGTTYAFDSGQFSLSGTNVAIKSGAPLTNTIQIGTLQLGDAGAGATTTHSNLSRFYGKSTFLDHVTNSGIFAQEGVAFFTEKVTIDNEDLHVNTHAHLNAAYLSNATASRLVVTMANKELTNSVATATEAGYLSGVTSALQTQLDNRTTHAQVVTASNVLVAYTDTASSNRVRVTGGTGGITVLSTGSGGVQSFEISDDDLAGGSVTNFVNLNAGRMFISQGLFLSNVTASSLLMSDPQKWVTNVTLGNGLTLSGTTLSADVYAAAVFATDNLIVRSDGAGKAIQKSTISLADDGSMSGVSNISMIANASLTMAGSGNLTMGTGSANIDNANLTNGVYSARGGFRVGSTNLGGATNVTFVLTNGPHSATYLPAAATSGVFTITFAAIPAAGSPPDSWDLEIYNTNLTATVGYWLSDFDTRGNAPVLLSGPSTNSYQIRWNGTSIYVFSRQEITTGSGALVASNAPTILNATLTTPTVTWNPGAVSNLVQLGAGSIAVSTNGGSQATVTNVVFKGTAAVGSNDASGTFSLHVNRSGLYRTIYVDAAAMISNITAGATFSTEESQGSMETTNKMIDSYVFDGTTSNAVQFKLAMPLEWNLGTIKVKLWTWSTNNLATTTNIWGIQAVALKNSSILTNLTWGTEQLITNVVSSDGGAVHLTNPSSALTVGNSPTSAGNLVLFRLRRLPGNADDNDGGQQKLLGGWVQYKEQEAEVASW